MEKLGRFFAGGFRVSRRLLVVLVFIVFGRSLALAQGNGTLQIHYLDLTVGAAAVLISPGGEVVLLADEVSGDCGRPLAYLQGLGLTRIDYVVARDRTARDPGCLRSIVSLFSVQKAVAGEPITLDATSIAPVTIRWTAGGRAGRVSHGGPAGAVVHFGNFDAQFGGDLASSIDRVEIYQPYERDRQDRNLFGSSSDTHARLVVSPDGPGDVVVEVVPGASLFTVRSRGSAATYAMWDATIAASSATSAAPFGIVDTPLQNATGVVGAIAVTGWALDDQEVATVRVFRSPVGAEPAGTNIFIGNAVLVTGTRPDVAAAFPAFPFKDRAGWGYLLLTNLLPGQGNGQYTLWIYADDREGSTTLLGSRTFTGTNAASKKPFGTIDSPGQGEAITGSTFINFGWVLTPQPATVPFDGSTIDVYVDNVLLGHPVYNNFRADIAGLFPGLNNTNGAVGYFVLNTSMLTNGTHTVFWIARDDAGNSEGIGSRYFSFCASPFSISPTSRSHGAGAEAGTVSVTTANGCLWTATSNAQWITITAGTSGSGSGALTYAVVANPTTSARSGTLTIAGQPFTVTQAGAACVPTISPTSRSHGTGAETGTIAVTAVSGCSWAASSNASWLAMAAGGSGTGDGTVTYTVAPNPDTSVRTGTLTIGGQVFTATQAGTVCAPSISPTSRAHGASAETGTIDVTAGTGCGWTASSEASWITITAGTSGSGIGTVTYALAANTTTSARTGTLTVAGQTFTVTQAGATCTTSIAPTSRTHGSGAETGIVTVTALSGCAWTAFSNVTWVTITAGNSGSGNGAASYTVVANPDANSRTGTLTIAGQVFTLTQAGVSCAPSISPASRAHGAGSEPGTVTVTAPSGCTWTAASNATWVAISAGNSGSGNGTVGYTVAANADANARTGTLTIAGQIFTITQAGAACTTAISPTSRSHGSGAETGTVSVTAGSGCTWTAVSNASWLAITGGSSGSADGNVSYSVAANTGSARTGTLTIAGQVFTVTQSAGAQSFVVTITSTGVSPKTLVVPLGTQVTFVNNSGQVHDMTSDPHPEHTDCPEINSVGFIQPGQSKQTGNLVTIRTCSYHDHDLPFNTSLQGSIVIQSSLAPVSTP